MVWFRRSGSSSWDSGNEGSHPGRSCDVLVELAHESSLGFEIHETSAPVHEGVRAACELLGLDPFYVANEGKLIAIVSAEDADSILSTFQAPSSWERGSS